MTVSSQYTIAAPRFATKDIELAGQQIKKGDVLIVALSSANHDEAAFTQPEELDFKLLRRRPPLLSIPLVGNELNKYQRMTARLVWSGDAIYGV